MNSYHKLEKSTCDSVRNKTFKRIPGKLTWRNKEDFLQEEAAGVAIDLDVHHVWAADFGLLVMVIGVNMYLADTILNYVELLQTSKMCIHT